MPFIHYGWQDPVSQRFDTQISRSNRRTPGGEEMIKYKKITTTKCAECGHGMGAHSSACEHCDCRRFVEAEPEFSCRHRFGSEAWLSTVFLDYWFENRWSHGTDYFPDGTKPPRTCSYCGGVNPDDAIAMIRQGWEIEATTKSYKRYLHPKGYAEYIRNLISGIPGLPEADQCRSPVPPVKMYLHHFSDEQIMEINRATSQRSGRSL